MLSAQFVYLFYLCLIIIVFPFSAFNYLLLNTHFFSDLKPFVITSGSMEPEVPSGSLIYTVSEKRYAKGDVVAFLTEKGNIAHRIEKPVSFGGINYFSTKGDANNTNDLDLVQESVIYGKIITIIPYLGGVVSFFKTPLGFLIGVLITVIPFLVTLKPKKIPSIEL